MNGRSGLLEPTVGVAIAGLLDRPVASRMGCFDPIGGTAECTGTPDDASSLRAYPDMDRAAPDHLHRVCQPRGRRDDTATHGKPLHNHGAAKSLRVDRPVHHHSASCTRQVGRT
jgi:hypothetical protein